MNTSTKNIAVEIDAAAIEDASDSSSYLIIRTNGGPGANQFAFSFTKPEDFARRVQNGPVLSGPYLCGFGVASVIHNGPVTANPVAVFLRDGDIVRVRDLVERGHLRYFDFEVTIKRGYPEFDCVRAFEYPNAGRGTRELSTDPVEISAEEYSALLKAEFDAKYGS